MQLNNDVLTVTYPVRSEVHNCRSGKFKEKRFPAKIHLLYSGMNGIATGMLYNLTKIVHDAVFTGVSLEV